MRKAFLYSLLLFVFLISWIQPVAAKQIQLDSPNSTEIISCFSGGQEILRKEIISGPFADEYKFAHEVTVKDETGIHNLNFTGGLCVIDRGAVSISKKLGITDNLSCYSGMQKVVTFEVRGRETTVDEYVEGRTFVAIASGLAFNSKSLHEYLVFGNDACIGEETS